MEIISGGFATGSRMVFISLPPQVSRMTGRSMERFTRI